MRYFVLPVEGLDEDMRAALARGLGLSSHDALACERHCRRYGVTDAAAFVEELEEAQAALAAARKLGSPIRVDGQGRLCYDLPRAPANEAEAEGWRDDAWLAALFSDRERA